MLKDQSYFLAWDHARLAHFAADVNAASVAVQAENQQLQQAMESLRQDLRDAMQLLRQQNTHHQEKNDTKNQQLCQAPAAHRSARF